MLPFGLSVVIPAHNRPKLLLRAIESVQSSDLDSVEIIVVDDGSSEDLQGILPCKNESGITVRGYRLERNSGPQTARNLGIRRARFGFVAFLDSDDTFSCDKIDVLLSELRGNDLDVIFHSVGGMRKYRMIANCWLRQCGLPFSWLLAIMNPVPTPGLVVRRSRRLGIPGMRYCEDYGFLLRYVNSSTRVRFLDRNLSSVSRAPGQPGGVSVAAWRMRKGEFRARRILIRTPTVQGVVKYFMGSCVGVLKIANDLVRQRYGLWTVFKGKACKQ